MARLLTVVHNCGHETTFTVSSGSPQPTGRKVAAPVMCPACEADADLLTCARCGQPHPREHCVIRPSSLAVGRDCLPATA